MIGFVNDNRTITPAVEMLNGLKNNTYHTWWMDPYVNDIIFVTKIEARRAWMLGYEVMLLPSKNIKGFAAAFAATGRVEKAICFSRAVANGDRCILNNTTPQFIKANTQIDPKDYFEAIVEAYSKTCLIPNERPIYCIMATTSAYYKGYEQYRETIQNMSVLKRQAQLPANDEFLIPTDRNTAIKALNRGEVIYLALNYKKGFKDYYLKALYPQETGGNAQMFDLAYKYVSNHNANITIFRYNYLREYLHYIPKI